MQRGRIFVSVKPTAYLLELHFRETDHFCQPVLSLSEKGIELCGNMY